MSIMHGDMDLNFTVNVHNGEALADYIMRYPDQWPDERTILLAMVRQSYDYRLRTDVAGTDGFADLPEGIVSIDWEDAGLSAYHAGEWFRTP